MPATSDFSRARECDALIVCVPTPLNKFREPDLSFVLNTVESLAPHLRPGQVLSLESTTYPGTTDEELKPRVEARRPEGRHGPVPRASRRSAKTRAIPNTRRAPSRRCVGGTTPACLEAGLALYGPVIEKVVPVSSTRVAEMTKLLENIHRAVNIGLVNEMKIICDRMGIDVHEVIRAAATKPFGFVPY